MREVRIDRPSLRTRILLYGAVPLVLVGGMAVAYYHGPDALRRLVSPEHLAVHPDSQREFGLLESLQNAALLALAVVAAIGVRRKRVLLPRVVLWGLLLAGAFVLLEETDYGMHYAELFRGEPVTDEQPGWHNLHRVTYMDGVLHNVAKFGMLTFFGGFAIVFAGSRNATLRHLAPDRMSVLTILLVTGVQEWVWHLAETTPVTHGSLSGNGREIEFTELGMYGLALVYAVDLAFWRRAEETA